MFPEGIGLLFHNGVDTLGYYASRTRTLLVDNAGLITATALGRYYFPQATAVAFGGVIASRGASWIAREIDARYHVHIADIHDWIVSQLPGSVLSSYATTVNYLAKPSRFASRQVSALEQRFHFINDALLSELLAPIYEELVYRYAGQELLAQMMVAVGVPKVAATGIAMAISDTLFAASHQIEPTHGQFRDLIVVGAAFGAMMHFHGLPAAMLTHSCHNASIRLQQSLMKKNAKKD